MGIVMTLVDMGGGFPGLDGDEEVRKMRSSHAVIIRIGHICCGNTVVGDG